jgi:hypothetical protein
VSLGTGFLGIGVLGIGFLEAVKGKIETMTNQKYISKLVLWGTALISLLITPFSFDPLNVSKFALLSIFGFAIYSLILTFPKI